MNSHFYMMLPVSTLLAEKAKKNPAEHDSILALSTYERSATHNLKPLRTK